MPVIEIKTTKTYEEVDKLKILKAIDSNLIKNLNLEESRFLVYWNLINSDSFLYKGMDLTESNNIDYPIVQIYSMEGKSQSIERTIMETVLHALAKGLNIDYRNISIIFNRINSGNIYANGNYLRVKTGGG